MKYIEVHTRDTTPAIECRYYPREAIPDIEISSMDRLLCRIEVKMKQGVPFVTAQKKIGLAPCEALAIDERKFDNYLRCYDNDRKAQGRSIPSYVVWRFDRDCPNLQGITVFQDLITLQALRKRYGRSRFHQRNINSYRQSDGSVSGDSDPYHFSLKETQPIEDLVPLILEAARSLSATGR